MFVRENYHNCIRYRISSYNKYHVTSIFCYSWLHKCLNYLIRFCVLTIKLYMAFIFPVTVVEIVQCSMDHYCLHTKKVRKVSSFSLWLLVIVFAFFEYEMLKRIEGRLTFSCYTVLTLKGSEERKGNSTSFMYTTN